MQFKCTSRKDDMIGLCQMLFILLNKFRFPLFDRISDAPNKNTTDLK